MVLQKENLKLQALRGATTTQSNETKAIETAVRQLVSELAKRNELEPEHIVSIIFSVTNDLNACFPAAIARRQAGWENVALLDCQQMQVEGDLKYCIRLMAHVFLPANQKPQHTYLGEATLLRPDRSTSN